MINRSFKTMAIGTYDFAIKKSKDEALTDPSDEGLALVSVCIHGGLNGKILI